MWNLCKYKNALGVPGKGIHSYRICNLAIVDFAFTFLGARLLQIFLFPDYHYLSVFSGLFLLSIVVHRMFCVKTSISKLLFS